MAPPTLTETKERQLKVLQAKKENHFTRVQQMYDLIKDLSDPSTAETFRIRSRRLKQTENEFTEAINQINDLKSELDPTFVPDFHALEAFRDLCGAIDIALDGLKSKEANSSTLLLQNAEQPHSRAIPRLPKLELPEFSGDIREWAIFFETFKSLVHENKTLTPSDKVHYLVGRLSGRAASVCSGIPATGINYEIIWKALIEKYNDTRALANSYLDQLFEFKTVTHDSSNSNFLNQFLERFDSAVAAFKQLEIDNQLDFILFYLAYSKLDSETCKLFEIARHKDGLPTYDELVCFIKHQTKICNRFKNITLSSKNSNPSYSSTKKKITHTFVVNENRGDKCGICKQAPQHTPYRCAAFKALNAQQRFGYVRANKWCSNCLSTTHQVGQCRSKEVCSVCKAKHHTLLHFDRSYNQNKSARPFYQDQHNHVVTKSTTADPVSWSGPSQNSIEPQPTSSTVVACSTSSADVVPLSTILLSTALVNVVDRFGRTQQIRFLLDTASQSNFITFECCRRLGLSRSRVYSSVIGIGQAVRSVKGQTHLVFASRFDSTTKYSINCLIIDQITNYLPTSEVNTSGLNYLNKIPLADDTYFKPSAIDGIIGAELYPHLLGSAKVTGPPSLPIAVETSLGFVVMGSAPTNKPYNVTQTFCSTNPPLETLFSQFCEIEDVGSVTSLSEDEKTCETIFSASLKRDSSGRYSVSLPFKQDPSVLGDSYMMAKRRFVSLEKRLHTSLSLHEQYSAVIKDYIDQGHMSLTNEEEKGLTPSYYIPHHAVCKTDSTTTPVRVVFDASAKSDSSYSLNDILHSGPKLQTDLFAILLNFRLFPVAMIADIKQMYRQINLTKEHRRFQRILWRFSPEDKLETYELNTVSFGVKSSPYLAIRTLHQLAIDDSERFPDTSEIINRDLYVDDLVCSVENIDKATLVMQQLNELFMAGGFQLHKWSCNSPELVSKIPKDSLSTQIISFDFDSLKVLGLQWNCMTDNFCFKITSPSHSKCTKRNIYSTVARIFDPLGLLSPITLYAKLIVKELWKAGIDWDEQVPSHLQNVWNRFQSQLVLLGEFKIPRHLSVFSDSRAEIIGFADASEKAYAAVVYIRTKNEAGIVQVSLVCSKSRVSPLKVVSIPRLELCAAVLLSKLMKFVRDRYDPRYIFENEIAFSDSMVVLNWLNASPSRWKTFVANRVSKIQENCPAKTWFHISGNENPADCISRGMIPADFMRHAQWLTGPSWLLQSKNAWPVQPIEPVEKHMIEEKTIALPIFNKETNPVYQMMLRHSSWIRLLHATVYVLRFLKRLPIHSEFSVRDLEVAEIFLVRVIQQIYFPNDFDALANERECSADLKKLRPFLRDGVLRVGGRLSNSDLDFEVQHPLLLPKDDKFVELLIDHHHRRNFHTGPHLLLSILRQKYWILSARNIVRRRILACNHCFRTRPRPVIPMMADLPVPRVTQCKPFTHTGVDYAGPFQITMSRRRGVRSQKAYLCLFVCLTVKAVHLELATDLSTPAFLSAFNRFLSRRGPVSTVYSDQGTNFIGARSYLKDLYQLLESTAHTSKFHEEMLKHQITWKVNPPRSPHFGGLWESQVRSVKTHLTKTIGDQILTFEELTTVLTQIEALLNSRPLSPLSSDPSEPLALTPAHFLTLTPLQTLPATDLTGEPTNRLTRKQLLDQLVQSYWRRWALEYLTSLQTRQKWNTPTLPVSRGMAVIIIEDNTPPLHWPIGIIDEVFPGKDGVVRVATVRTKHGFFKRPVVRLCPLPTQ